MAWDAEWDEMHGYHWVKCPHCGWSGKTDGDVPECGCYDRHGDGEPREPDESCECGACQWEDVGYNPTCAKCGTGPLTEGIYRTSTHTARKHFYAGAPNIEIRPGDRYRKTVSRDFYPGGAWGPWHLSRKRISKGWGWADQHTVEPKPNGWDERPQGWDGHPLAAPSQAEA